MPRHARFLVDRSSVLRQFTETRFVPLNGDLRELGFEARAAPATVSGVPYIENHWIVKSGKVMKGLQAASQETYLSWSPIEQPGCAEREETPSGDGAGCACAGLRCFAPRLG